MGTKKKQFKSNHTYFQGNGPSLERKETPSSLIINNRIYTLNKSYLVFSERAYASYEKLLKNKIQYESFRLLIEYYNYNSTHLVVLRNVYYDYDYVKTKWYKQKKHIAHDRPGDVVGYALLSSKREIYNLLIDYDVSPSLCQKIWNPLEHLKVVIPAK